MQVRYTCDTGSKRIKWENEFLGYVSNVKGLHEKVKNGRLRWFW